MSKTLSMGKTLALVKGLTILAFMSTLFTTYYLRSELLELNAIRYSSEIARTDESLRVLKESIPDRMAEYDVNTKNYETQMQHYRDMLQLYQTDYEAYVKRLKDEFHPPQLPVKPEKPMSPELSDQLTKINAEFRKQQFHYFASNGRVNWICCISAMVLVGGLLFLMMFETGNHRFLYLVVLFLSFVFMIGPSFHSIMSVIVGLMSAPPVF